NVLMPELDLNDAHLVAILAYYCGKRWQQEHELPRREFQLLLQALEGVPVVYTKDPRYTPVLQKLREVKKLTEQLAHPGWDTNLGPEFCSAGQALLEVIKSAPPGKTEWLNWIEQSEHSPAAEQSSSNLAPKGPIEDKPPAPVELFYAYSHKDERQRDRLEKHLAMLKRQGVIAGWH